MALVVQEARKGTKNERKDLVIRLVLVLRFLKETSTPHPSIKRESKARCSLWPALLGSIWMWSSIT